MHFVEKAVKFTPQDAVNPDLSAFTFFASLSSPQQVQSSDGTDINHELKGGRLLCISLDMSIIMWRPSLDHTM